MRKKIIVTIAIILAMIVAQFSVFINCVKAETITGSDGDVSWSFNTETQTLTFSGSGEITSSYKDILSEFEIKHVVINEGITSIGYCAFLGHVFSERICTDTIEDVEIPNSVVSIGESAFERCKSLKKIEIPGSVNSIGEVAFLYCMGLNNIEVDESNSEYSSENGVLFSKDKNILICCPAGKSGSYQIPDIVTNVEAYAFAGCEGLTDVEIPNSVTSIGNGAFIWCENISKITIPNSVTSMQPFAFLLDNGSNSNENLKIYCKSDSSAKQYAEENNIPYVVDDTAPTVNLTQDGNSITVEATDNEGGAGLSSKAYSLDGENWQSSNKFEVTKSGTYTIYVKDKLYNIANKTIDVTISEPSDDKGGSTPENQDNGNKKESSDGQGQDNNVETKSDDSQAKTNIPDTGAYFPIAIIAIAGAICIIRGIKYRKNKF